MRKQTKVVAVASAAALLAIGASMTSFAATGWVEEDGTWYFYDKDGNRVENEWKKSGDNWYWLDSEEGGAMAVDKLVEDGDNLYYVDSNGVMVRNTWVKVVNEEQDDEEDPAEYNYYYMQANGKAYKSGTNNNTKFKTIDGKRFAFDDDGKMLYGWVDDNGSRLSDESGWESATYYCGSWDDGAMKIGWQRVNVYDEDEDEDMDYWFNFKSNGKKRFLDTSTSSDSILEKSINGKKYGFDDRGVMVYEWTVATNATTPNLGSTQTWKYFNSPEDGARITKGWFKVVAPTEDNSFGNVIQGPATASNTFAPGKAEDEEEKWYYADGDGNLKAGKVEKIKGKYYAFHPEGWMLNGLVLMEVDSSANVIVWDDGVDSDELDNLMDGVYLHDTYGNPKDDPNVSLYYFGSDEDHDGAMKTGSVTVSLDGDSYNFQFRKSGGVESKGKGLSGIDDNKYIYKYGQKMKASADDKYIAVTVSGSNDVGTDSKGSIVNKVDLVKTRSAASSSSYKNKDKETVMYDNTWGVNTYLLNTSGSIVKNKTAGKDGSDWYFYVKDKQIKLYSNNKTLQPLKKDDGSNANGTLDLSDWKNDFDSSTN